MSFSSLLIQQLLEKQKQDQMNQMIQLPVTQSMDFASLIGSNDTSSLMTPPMPQQSLPQPFSGSLGYTNPFQSMLTPQSPTMGIGEPNFTPTSNSSLYANPNDFMQSNDDILNQFKDFDSMANSYIGNSSSNQIDSIIADLQNQQKALPNDVGLGTKLIATTLGAIGGATGNQALSNQGFSILEGGRQELRNKKDQLNQQEIAARKIKYEDTVKKEIMTRDSLLDLYRKASSYAGAQAANAMDYKTKVSLAKLDTDIRMKIQNSQFLQQQEMKAIDNGYELPFKQAQMFGQFLNLGLSASDAQEIAINIVTKGVLTPEQQTKLDTAMSSQKNLKQIEQNEEKALKNKIMNDNNRRIPRGAMAEFVDTNAIDQRKISMVGNPYNDKYSQSFNRFQSKAVRDQGKFVTGRGDVVDNSIYEASEFEQIDPKWLFSMLFNESAFNPLAVSNKGATGISQIMPDTAKIFGLDINRLRSSKPEDIAYAVAGGAKILKYTLDKNGGDYQKALMAYNSGHEKEIISYDLNKGIYTYKVGNKLFENNKIPSETREYVTKIQGGVDGYDSYVGDDASGERSMKRQVEKVRANAEAGKKFILARGKIVRDDKGQPLVLNDPTAKDRSVTREWDFNNPEDKLEFANEVLQHINRAYQASGLQDTSYYRDDVVAIEQRAGNIKEDSQIIKELEETIKVKVVAGVDPYVILDDINRRHLDGGSYNDPIDGGTKSFSISTTVRDRAISYLNAQIRINEGMKTTPKVEDFRNYKPPTTPTTPTINSNPFALNSNPFALTEFNNSRKR